MKLTILFFLFFWITTYSIPKRVHLVVACHGNMDLTPHLSLENFRRFYQDDIVGSLYETNVKNLRNNPFFYIHHPMQFLGLHPIDITIKRNYAAGLFAHIHHTLSYPQNTLYCYYTFGWSGIQSPKARLAEAKILYEQLKKEVARYVNQGYNTTVTLIGYSHGGNVALNIAAYFNENDVWHIDTLVLLGVPIISESSVYAFSKVFKKIYNFYSLADRVQPLDCFGNNRIFSGRCLNHLGSSCNIYDIQLRIKRANSSSSLYHPLQRAIKKSDPSHVEWWSFGWTTGYRNYFALHPLPVSVVTPLFIQAIEKLCLSTGQIIIDLHAYKNVFYVDNGHQRTTVNFIKPALLTLFKKQAKQVQPSNYSQLLFKQQVNAVLYQNSIKHIIPAR